MIIPNREFTEIRLRGAYNKPNANHILISEDDASQLSSLFVAHRLERRQIITNPRKNLKKELEENTLRVSVWMVERKKILKISIKYIAVPHVPFRLIEKNKITKSR